MNEKRIIIDSIQSLTKNVGNGIVLFDAEVTSVDRDSCSCLVSSIDYNIDDIHVRLMPGVADGELNIPSVGENITVCCSNKFDPYMFGFSWLDEKEIIIGDTTISLKDGDVEISQGKMVLAFKKGKISIKNDSKDFKTIIDNLFDNIAKLTVPTPSGTSSPPVNVNDFIQGKTDFDSLFS